MTIDSRRRGIVKVGVVLLAFSGCSESLPPPTVVVSRKPVKVADLPQTILKSARKALRGVTFEQAWTNRDESDSTIAYELRGTTKEGKIRDVKLDPKGNVLEIE